MAINEMLLPEFDQEMANTRKLLERYPENKPDFKPHEKSMAFGRLAGHVAELPMWLTTTLTTEVLELQAGQTPYVATSRQELLDTFDKNVREARAALAAANDDQMSVPWTLKFSGKTIMSMPRNAVVRSMVMNHLIHHRAQLGVYLRLNDIELPGMYGPSADEMKFWAAQTV